MSLDIEHILEDWPFEPEKVSARLIEGAEGQPRIQLRMDLGLLQMHVNNRPDGQRPYDCDTLLAHYQEMLREHRNHHGSETSFALEPNDCEDLRRESLQFYHRYLAEFVLEDYGAVLRDTRHNLAIMDMLADHAAAEDDRASLESHRPYVLMMHTRARALLAFRQDRPRAALAAVQKGIRQIHEFYDDHAEPMPAGRCGEIRLLQDMHDRMAAELPEDPVQKLRDELEQALKEERYEDAACLRDELREIDEP